MGVEINAKAEATFQHALTLAEKGPGQEHTSVTGYLNDLADTYCTTGAYKKGEGLYERALAVHERKAAMSHPAVQDTLFGLARCAAEQGRLSDAAKLQTQASELEERYVALNLAVGSEREKLALLTELSSRLSRNVSLHVSLAPHDMAARDLAMLSILRSKGRVQDAMSASLSALRQRSGPEDQKLLDQLNDATAKLAKLILDGLPQKATPAEYQEQTKRLEEQRENLEVEIIERSAGFYQRTQPVTLASVQALIPEDGALVEFAVYRPFDPKAPNNWKAYGAPRYVAYVLRRQGEVQWKELGEARTTDGAVDALRRALGDPQRRDVRELARGLDEKLMRPLRALTGNAMQLLISPDANFLTGEGATKSALKQTVAPRILHIATHGFFLQSPQTVADGDARAATATRGAEAAAESDNPLLRSGLALAGANRRSGAAADEGILTALEASGLNLWGTKLVVLSACDTGLGEVHNGEGVYGLRRAFVLAGAESLVMSLWPASDYSTRSLMASYYRNLKQGLGRGAALRQVQLDMLRRDPQLHPFYWANFIQSGEWANLDGKR